MNYNDNNNNLSYSILIPTIITNLTKFYLTLAQRRKKR